MLALEKLQTKTGDIMGAIESQVAALRQELKDFKESSMSYLKAIDEQTKKTNGRVNKQEIEITLAKQAHAQCPARMNYKSDKNITREWIRWIPAVLTSLMAFAAVVISIFALKI